MRATMDLTGCSRLRSVHLQHVLPCRLALPAAGRIRLSSSVRAILTVQDAPGGPWGGMCAVNHARVLKDNPQDLPELSHMLKCPILTVLKVELSRGAWHLLGQKEDAF